MSNSWLQGHANMVRWIAGVSWCIEPVHSLDSLQCITLKIRISKVGAFNSDKKSIIIDILFEKNEQNAGLIYDTKQGHKTESDLPKSLKLRRMYRIIFALAA